MKIQWKVERRKVSDLKAWDKNPRKLDEQAFLDLKKKITERGFHDIFKIDTDNTILSGNQRKQALIELGVEEVDVIVPERALTEKERDAVALESNRHSGIWDYDMLGAKFEVPDLLDYGFTLGELGIGDGAGKEAIDVDNMASSLEGYMNSDIKQIILYFKGTEFEDIVRRLEEARNEMGLKDNSELLLKLLETYEIDSASA